MADYADDAAALLDAVGWERVRVVGVSFGGMVALELVLGHPDRVSKLVLCCTSPGGEGAGHGVDFGYATRCGLGGGQSWEIGGTSSEILLMTRSPRNRAIRAE